MSAIDPTKPGLLEPADPLRYGWRNVFWRDADGNPHVDAIPLTREDVRHPQEGYHIVQSENRRDDDEYLAPVLRVAAANRPGLHVWADMGVDWSAEGERYVCPDFTVVEGLPPTWDRGKALQHVTKLGARVLLVLEITSPSTRDDDLNWKVAYYARRGVPWYAIVDHQIEKEPHTSSLLGYRLTPSGYERIPLDERGWLWLEPLGIWLGLEGHKAVCYDRQGQRLMGGSEALQAVRQADARAEEAASLMEKEVLARREAEQKTQEAEARAHEVAARLQELEAELRRIRGQP